MGTTMKRPEDCTNISDVRAAIDAIDREIVLALGQRFEYVKTIMRFKKTADDVRAPQRYQQVLAARRAWAAEAELDPDVVEKMYRDLIAYFIAEEMTHLNLEQS